jgi:hypothetical protein
MTMIINPKFEILLIPVGNGSRPMHDRDYFIDAATGSMGIVSLATEMKGVFPC